MNSNRMVVTQTGVLKSSQKQNYADSVLVKYVLSCGAATAAEIVTYPLDLAKTRLQIQGEQSLKSASKSSSKKQPYRGLFRTGVGIIKEEGFLKLWQGMTPAIYRHFIYTGTRMVLYEKVRDRFFTKRQDGSHPVWQAVVGGIAIGGIAQFLASPADLVKVQIQMEGRRRLEGFAPRVRGPGEAFIKIYNMAGLKGLWKGCMPNVYRSALVNLGDLTTYDSVKRFFINNCEFPDTYWTHALSSACSGLIGASLGTPADVVKARVMNQPTDKLGSAHSGLVSALLGTPADVVKARIMNQPTDGNGRGLLYKNSADCLIQTVRNEGFWALYKGFLPCWIRMGPWSLTFWITYEQIRNMCGTSAF